MPARRGAARKPTDRPQNRSVVTRRKLLEVAEQHLSRHGYGPSTMADVAERAGVSTGTLYYHFPDKRSLLLALIDAWGDRQVEQGGGGLARLFESGAVDLRATIDRFLAERSSELRNSGPLRLVLLEMAERDPEVAARLGRIEQIGMDRVCNLIAFGQARGFVRSTLDPLAAAFLVTRTVRSVAIEVLVHRVPLPNAEAVQRELVELIYSYLAADPRK